MQYLIHVSEWCGVYICCLCLFFLSRLFILSARFYKYVMYILLRPPYMLAIKIKKDDTAWVSLIYVSMHICFHVVCFYISTARSYMPPQRTYYAILRVFFRKFLICNTLGFYASRRYVIYYSNI